MGTGCEAIRERFLALEERRMAPDEAGRVREHLAGCERCRQAWERWQADDRLLREGLAPVAPARDIAGAAVAAARSGQRTRRVVLPRRVVRWGLVAAAALALLAVGGWWWLGTRYPRIGRVVVAEGRPMARQRGARFAKVVETGAPIYNWDELLVGEGGRLEVELRDGSWVRLGPKTEAKMSGSWSGSRRECGHRLPHVCLQQGVVECDLKSTRHFRAVGTPLGSAIVEGTRFRVQYVVGVRTVLEVFEGKVTFSCPRGEVRVGPGGVWMVDATEGIARRVQGAGAEGD